MAKVLAETCCYICLQPKLVLSLLNPLPMRANACQPLFQLELPNRTHTKSTECIQGTPNNTRPGRQWLQVICSRYSRSYPKSCIEKVASPHACLPLSHSSSLSTSSSPSRFNLSLKSSPCTFYMVHLDNSITSSTTFCL